MLRKFLDDVSIVRKDFLIVSILVINLLVWYFMTPIILNGILSGLNITSTQIFVIWAAYYVGTIGSMIVGSILSNRIDRLNLLYFWITLGVVTSLLPALLSNFTAIHILTISILFGVSLGLGIPSCFSYFADCTTVENRGRISGITLLIASLSAPFFVISFELFNLTVDSIIFAIWRGFGLMIFFLKPEEKAASEIEKRPSFTSILHDKSFTFYFIAWLMYFFIDRLERPVLNNFFGGFSYLMIAPIIGSLFALIAGILSDQIGRKRVVLYGFVTLGIAYGIIGIFPTALFSWYFFLTVESIATGMLYVAFILILWGDLSQSGAREKYYAIGTSPLFLASAVQLLSAPYFMLIPTTSAFSLAGFFLFLAVLPLLYAPETLPERKIVLRELRKYVEAAKKVQQKYA